MFSVFERFSRKDDLPIASSTYSHADGSGRAIHMDAPIVRAWKNSRTSTKVSYYCFFAGLCLVIFGYRHLRYNHASIWVSCHSQDCDVDITPTGRAGTTSLTVARKQLVRAESVKVDRYGNFVSVDNTPLRSYSTGRGSKQYKKEINGKGPDKDGNYASYALIFSSPQRIDGSTDEDFVELNALDEFLKPAYDGSMHRVLIMKQFNMKQSKRRSRSMVNRVDSYIKERRHSVTAKENAGLSWQGILSLVVGLFTMLFSILLGTIFEEDFRAHPKRRQRSSANTTKKKATAGAPRRPIVASGSNRAVGSSRSGNSNMRYRPSKKN